MALPGLLDSSAVTALVLLQRHHVEQVLLSECIFCMCMAMQDSLCMHISGLACNALHALLVLQKPNYFLSSCVQQAAAVVGHRHEALNLLINSAGRSGGGVWGFSAPSSSIMCSPVWWRSTHNAAVLTAHCIANCPGLHGSSLRPLP